MKDPFFLGSIIKNPSHDINTSQSFFGERLSSEMRRDVGFCKDEDDMVNDKHEHHTFTQNMV